MTSVHDRVEASARRDETTGDRGPVGPGPGWHADPWQVSVYRYYDGATWTSHVTSARRVDTNSGGD
jgi:hypothetical protein